MKKRIIYILSAILIFLSGNSLSAGSASNPIPSVTDGYLDLNNWSFESDGVVQLNGDWDFYWNELLYPEDFSTGQLLRNKSLYTLPSVWNGHSVNNQKIGGAGFATYRLRISIPEKYRNEILVMKIPYVFTAYRLWINGIESASNGKVGKDRGNMVPQYLSQMCEFVPGSSSIDVILQISNFYHNRGGLRAPIIMGTNSPMDILNTKKLIFDMLMLTSLFILGLYNIVLYLLWRKEKTLLLFGLLCLLFSLRTGLIGETILLSIFDFIPWMVHVRIEWLSVYFSPFLFITFLSEYFPAENRRVAVRMVQAYSLILSAVTVFFSPYIFTTIFSYIWFINVFIFVYCLYVIIMANIRKHEGSMLMLIGYIIPFFMVLNDILYARDIIHTGHFLSFGIFSFAFFYAFVLSRKNARHYKMVESLSSELVLLNNSLEEKVEERTAELTRQKKELQEAADNVKTLSGLIPICSSCKKIRDDKGYWDQLESYISKYSEAEFTHGLCPDCARNLYPDIDLSKLK